MPMHAYTTQGENMSKPIFNSTQLEKLQLRLVTDKAIGDTVQISRSAVCQLRKKYGICSLTLKIRRQWREVINELWGNNDTKQIAKKAGCSVDVVNRHILYKYGYRRSRRNKSPITLKIRRSSLFGLKK
jgi:hypothetical protein